MSYEVWTVGTTIITINYVGTTHTTITTVLPYPCDGVVDREALIVQRIGTYSYKDVSNTPNIIPVKIIDELTGKAKCIYEKLKSSSLDFENAIKKFDGDFTVSHLKLTINNSLPLNVYGETQLPVDFITEIQINNNGLNNLSDLGKAMVFAHEIIHAEIFRKMLSAAQIGTLTPDSSNMNAQQQVNYINSMKDNFPGLYDYYYKRYKPTWNHEMMANHYRETIADIIQQFDNNRLPRSTYEAVSWLGLGKLDSDVTTIAWDNLSATEKSRITDLINENFYKGPSNCN